MPNASSSTATRTVAQILDELQELFEGEGGGDKIIEHLNNSSVPVVKKFRSKAFAGGKTQGGKDVESLTEQLDKAKEDLANANSELEKLRKTTPNLAEETKKLTDKHEAEKKKLTEERDALQARVNDLGKESSLNHFVETITSEEFGVDKDYATEVLRPRVVDRLVVDKKTGQVTGVLKPGETTPYEAESTKDAIKLLAADLRKGITNTKFITSNGDSGGGIRGTRDGGSVTGKPDLDQMAAAKAASGNYGSF